MFESVSFDRGNDENMFCLLQEITMLYWPLFAQSVWPEISTIMIIRAAPQKLCKDIICITSYWLYYTHRIYRLSSQKQPLFSFFFSFLFTACIVFITRNILNNYNDFNLFKLPQDRITNAFNSVLEFTK